MKKLQDRPGHELTARQLLCANCPYAHALYGNHELTNSLFVVRQAVLHLLWSKSTATAVTEEQLMPCMFMLAYPKEPWLCAKYLFVKEEQVCVLFSGLQERK